MQARDYFPLGKAKGASFCNRQQETQWLKENMLSCKHSLLVAPRRYGKSSLAERAIANSQLPFAAVSFNVCTDEEDVAELIKLAVVQLIGCAIGPAEKIINIIKQYCKSFTPKIIIGPDVSRLELQSKAKSTPMFNVSESLRLIETLLEKKKKRAVVLFDEFQNVGLIAKGAGVEAAIRNAAQDMKYLSIIFSGSSRTLLTKMFEDAKRPLFKLCRKLQVERIDERHYVEHLNKAAKIQWHHSLSQPVFQRIMFLSERHPYYVNYLCDVFFTNSKKNPSIHDVDLAWDQVCKEELSDINAELSLLSMGQKKILKFIAHYPNESLMSSDSSRQIGLALSSISVAVSALLKKDMIEKHRDGYRILNPVAREVLSDEKPSD